MTAVTSNNTHTVRQLWVSYCNTGRRCEIVSHLFWQSLVGQSCLWRCATTGAEIKAYLHWSLTCRWSASRSQAPLPWVHLSPPLFCAQHMHIVLTSRCLLHGTSTTPCTPLPCFPLQPPMVNIHRCPLLLHVGLTTLPGDDSGCGRTFQLASLSRTPATEWICLIV